MNYLTKWFQKFNANGESSAFIAKLQKENAELTKRLKDALDSYNKEALVSQEFKRNNEKLSQEIYALKSINEKLLPNYLALEKEHVKQGNELRKEIQDLTETIKGKDQEIESWSKQAMDLTMDLTFCDCVPKEETKKKNGKKKDAQKVENSNG